MATRLFRDDGFTFPELLVSTVIMLIVVGTTLTTFKNGLDINDTASQVGDANQNLRAGSNQLVRDLMMAGRIVANGGVPAPAGVGAVAIARPGPPGSALTFNFVADDDGTLMLPAITTGFGLGPTINGSMTDIVTILTVDEFMPVLKGIGANAPGAMDPTMAVIAPDGSSLTMLNTSAWLVGDAVNDTKPIGVGDIVLFKNTFGMAMQTVTSKDTTHVNFAQNDAVNDWFHLNQRNSSFTGTVNCIKALDLCDATATPATSPVPAATLGANFPGDPNNPGAGTAIMRLLMITYYVDNTTTPGTPRLTRVLNHSSPQALAGVVEDMDLTYDLVDTIGDAVQNLQFLPQTINGVVYTSNMIKKVNLHLGVRSESQSKPTLNYVRNHISTSVGIRSLAATDRYDTSTSGGS